MPRSDVILNNFPSLKIMLEHYQERPGSHYNALLQGGRSPMKIIRFTRNTSVVQVCLPKDQAKRLKQVAKASEHKTVRLAPCPAARASDGLLR